MFILFIPVKVTGQNCYLYQLSRFSFLFRFQTNQKIWNKKKSKLDTKAFMKKYLSAQMLLHMHQHMHICIFI